MLKTLHKQAAPYLPGPVPLILYVFAWGTLAVGLIGAVAYGYGAYEGVERFGNFGFVFGFMVLPLVTLLTEVAMLIERKIPPKAALALSGTLFLLLTTVIASIAFSRDPDMDLNLLGGVGTGMLCCAPFVLLSAIPLAYTAVRLPSALRQIRQTQRAARAVELIQARGGQISYREIAEALHIPEDTVDDLLRRLLADREIMGVRLPQHQCFFTRQTLNARRRHLQGMINAQGEVSLNDLADELNVPMSLLREWLYELVEAGKFTGHLNWAEGRVYSDDVRKLRDGGICPNCRAPMSLVGKGVVRCRHCDTEVFLTGEPAPA